MSIDFQIKEWTEEREDESLRAADVAFIPVGWQRFSRAKSLNRCLTALLRGCQVLTRGYPLYRLVNEFIYRSAEELVADLDQGVARLEVRRLPRLYEFLDVHADPLEAASAFVRAAVSTPPGEDRKVGGTGAGPLFCLVHGRTSDTSLHKLAARSGGLSVGSPFQNKNLNYQLRFDCVDGELRCRIEKSRMKFLCDTLRARAIEVGRIIDYDFCELPIGDLIEDGAAIRMVVGQGRFDWLATYPNVMRTIKLVCRRIFPSAAVITSEQNELALAAFRRDVCPTGVPSTWEGVA